MYIYRRAFQLAFTITFLTSHISASNHPTSTAIPFSPGFDINAVLARATSLPSHSWEFGTASEALLELFDAPLAVFGAHPFPVPTVTPANSPSLTYAKEKIVIGVPPNGLSDGDGAVGDPASLGVSAVLLGKTDASFAAAAKAEALYVLNQAPKWPNGAISHRVMYAELWADFMYMAPPFLAYYGVASNNATILQIAVEQCLLYRQALQANTTSITATPPNTHPASASGLWTHILGPVNMDPGIWSTGNAWAAAGAMRVLATVAKAPTSLVAKSGGRAWTLKAIGSLVELISEILNAGIRASPDQGLLRNYLDDTTWFGETSGSALLASVAYRLSTFCSLQKTCPLSKGATQTYILWAEHIRHTFGTNDHITANGTATPAVNPLGWGDRTPYTAGSPEGQNFVILMYAAWRDCVVAGIPGCKAPL
ncbi:hypothetical protein GALMADRAFT_252889 [Galerina marginata CBS 339.88]|uniref:Six-hairpin glycosidase n=1 Tax=Galerina marginata (strain CBS 339.88) TaxID=685588 RepID=A0A067SRL4_GALM3|nr:hypothetical protein GALMADRAFT_252889 [Galerina marginata CBS 339.88]